MATLYNNISSVYQDLEDFENAEKYLRLALSVLENLTETEAERVTAGSIVCEDGIACVIIAEISCHKLHRFFELIDCCCKFALCIADFAKNIDRCGIVVKKVLRNLWKRND